MALNEQQLAAEINEAIRQADAASAPTEVRAAKGAQTSQRVALAKAIAQAVIQHIQKHAEVVVPDHQPFRTEVAPGPGPHAHPIVVPLRHQHGKVI